MSSFVLPCFLTVIIELIWFLCFGYEGILFILLCASVNIATNIALNYALSFCIACFVPAAIIGELIVLAVEYSMYCLAYGRSKRLFFLTLGANIMSLAIGILFRF